MFEIRRITPSDTAHFQSFTFPGYRHLLSLKRHVYALEDPARPEETKPISPFALGAFVDSKPSGLVLGSIPDASTEQEDPQRSPQILSLFVVPAHRQKGLGTALIAAAEEHLREHSETHVHGVYMTGKPSVEMIERIFAALGWSPPEFRFATARFTVTRLLEADWMQNIPTISGYEAVPWHQISEKEKLTAEEKHADSPWVHPALQFWKYGLERSEPDTSLGIRYKGEFVGWVLNHAFQNSRMLRFTCTYIRWDLARLGLALPAIAKSVRLMPEAGFSHGTFCTPEDLQGMRRAIAKYVAPWADFVGETRGVHKKLE